MKFSKHEWECEYPDCTTDVTSDNDRFCSMHKQFENCKKRFHIVMKPRTEEITLTIEAPNSEEAKNVAAVAYPRLEVKLVEEMVTCPWCSGEGCSYQGQAKGGCTDGEVPYSQALAMRLTNYSKNG